MSAVESIDASRLREMLRDEEEIALLDAREEGRFGHSHLLYASCAPLSRLELYLPRLAPRRGVRVVFCDAGEGLAERAAERARALGYTRVMVLDGGNAAASRDGFELFSGVNVPSKAFGEFVETACHTPSLSADELKSAMDRGERLVVLDSRPFDEYTVRNIPGGISCPGAELAYRVHDLAPEPTTRVVVNCAGRTRSIIGAQSLINAGIANPVLALRNGTMGWHLAGHRVEERAARIAPEPSSGGLAAAKACAERVAARFRVASIDGETLEKWMSERDETSLFLFDVRHPHEFFAGHRPGAVSAPGGQLVQETDQFIGTLKSRIVLMDDTGVRATMTASWLIQMGWKEVYVLRDGLAGVELERGEPEPAVLGLDQAFAPSLDAHTLAGEVDAGRVQVIDLSTWLDYQAGHVPGARFAQRAELASSLASLDGPALVLTCEDGRLSRLAAAELGRWNGRPVAWLSAGKRAYGAALALEPGAGEALCDPSDRYMRPYEKEWGNEQAMSDYLSWEVALVPKLERDGTALFLRA